MYVLNENTFCYIHYFAAVLIEAEEKASDVSAKTAVQYEKIESADGRSGSDYNIRVQLHEMSKDDDYQTGSDGMQSFAPKYDYIDIRPSTLLRKWNKYDGVKKVSTQNVDRADVKTVVVPPTDHADIEGKLTDANGSEIVEPQGNNATTSETSQPTTNKSNEMNSTEAEREATTGKITICNDINNHVFI